MSDPLTALQRDLDRAWAENERLAESFEQRERDYSHWYDEAHRLKAENERLRGEIREAFPAVDLVYGMAWSEGDNWTFLREWIERNATEVQDV